MIYLNKGYAVMEIKNPFANQNNDSMKTLRLEKTKVGRTVGRYLYKIYEGDQVLCQRTSNKNYVACHVYEIIEADKPPTFAAPMFFGRVELMTKQKGAVPYGIAYLADVKPVAL